MRAATRFPSAMQVCLLLWSVTGCGPHEALIAGQQEDEAGEAASALTVSSQVSLQSVETGRCLEVVGSAVVARDCRADAGAQQFRTQGVGNAFVVRSVSTGKCLDVGLAAWRSNPYLYDCHYGRPQLFRWWRGIIGVVESAERGGECLDFGARAWNVPSPYLYTCYGGAPQRFALAARVGSGLPASTRNATVLATLLPVGPRSPNGSFPAGGAQLTTANLPASMTVGKTASDRRLNVLSWNIGKGGDIDDDTGVYVGDDPGKAKAIWVRFQQFDADLLSVQELYYYGASSVIADVARAFGNYHVLYDFHRGNARDFGNLLVSRFPFLQAGYRDINRGGRRVIQGLVQTPMGTLRVFNVHVNRNDACTGTREALAYVRESVTAGEAFLVTGDFNLPRDQLMRCGGEGLVQPGCAGPTSVGAVNTCFTSGIDFVLGGLGPGPDLWQVLAVPYRLSDSHDLYVASLRVR